MLKTYQFKTHCKDDSHISKTANIILPGLMNDKTKVNVLTSAVCYGLRSPAGTTAENIFYLVATTSLPGGHQMLSGAHQITIWWPPGTRSLCGGHQIVIWWPPHKGGHQITMWWPRPPDNYLVAIRSLCGGHHIVMWWPC